MHAPGRVSRKAVVLGGVFVLIAGLVAFVVLSGPPGVPQYKFMGGGTHPYQGIQRHNLVSAPDFYSESCLIQRPWNDVVADAALELKSDGWKTSSFDSSRGSVIFKKDPWRLAVVRMGGRGTGPNERDFSFVVIERDARLGDRLMFWIRGLTERR